MEEEQETRRRCGKDTFRSWLAKRVEVQAHWEWHGFKASWCSVQSWGQEGGTGVGGLRVDYREISQLTSEYEGRCAAAMVATGRRRRLQAYDQAYSYNDSVSSASNVQWRSVVDETIRFTRSQITEFADMDERDEGRCRVKERGGCETHDERTKEINFSLTVAQPSLSFLAIHILYMGGGLVEYEYCRVLVLIVT